MRANLWGALLAATITLSAQVAVTTQHNDLNRTGANLSETVLNTSNVNVNTFGKLFSHSVDGEIYAQPLLVPNLSIPGQGTHNVVFVCTEHNSVYAFDADNAGAWAPLWHVNLGPSTGGVFDSVEPEVGITSTPVIDTTLGTLYVADATILNGSMAYQLHALDLTNGSEKFNGPITIQGSVAGTGGGSSGGSLAFNPSLHFQRPALVFANGNVYVSFGSHGNDQIPWHGWIFVYNASTLLEVTHLCLTPNGNGGGVWTGGMGLAVDASGKLYTTTGNGTFDASTGGADFGDSVIKLDPSNSLAVSDYFAPSNQGNLEANDADLGSSGPILLPNTSLGVSSGKDGRVFLFSTGNLGGYHTTDQVVQEWQATTSLLQSGQGGNFGTGWLYYNSNLYLWGHADYLRKFSFNGSTFNTTPVSVGTIQMPSASGSNGYSSEPAMSLSANGTVPGSAILWVAYPLSGDADGYAHPGILRAFDAADLTNERWNSSLNGNRDNSGSWAKWSAPTIANGKVYLATFDGLFNVFGLLSPGGGSLVGSGNSSQTAANLTLEGTTDWVHWGESALNRKANVGAQLSSYSIVGAGSASLYSGDPRPLSWSDGTPTTSGTNNTDGLYVGGVGNGLSFIAPADSTARTLTVHVGGWNSGGTLTAHLSDASAADFVDTTANTSGLYDRNYTLTYNAAGPNQALFVTWVMSSGTGNVSINGAALSGAGSSGPASITATGGTTQSATVGTAFATALQATVRDASNNPVSGVSVTFTAPSSGASGSFSGSSTVTTNGSGVATAPTFTANSTAGSYTVTASVAGVATPANFNLTNTGPANSITATGGTPQSTTVGTAFATALQATVRDGSNNPVSGVSVTFTAPSSGASGSFSGSSTVTTNGSGVATAPTFTANSTAGSYTVTAGVSGVATPASFNLTNNAVVSNGGALSGTANNSTAADNLTTEGTSDWVHWGDSSLNRKAGVAAQLSSYSEVGAGAIYKYAPDLRPLSWSDGTPTVSSTNNTDGLYINGAGNGFSFTASADTSTRTLIVHVGGWNSGGTLTAHLSDGSATDFSASTVNTSGQYDYNYTLTYNAASGGQTLTVTWKMSSGSGNVTLCGAALEGASSSGPASITATAGTTQSATVGTAFATALQATVRDSGNNPVSGVSVTFTAPSSGASGSFSGSSTVTTNGSGVATAPTFTANSTAGSYTVTASVSGVSTPASFNLTNNGPASITATAGTSQSATVGTAFATALQATVRDSGNNPVSGVSVTFTAPSSGASGSFSGSSTVTTNGSGVATAPTFTANSTAGSYTVTASVSGVSTPASFNLTNNAVVSNGALSGTANNSTAADNLTTEGTADWVHWGDSSLNRKAGVAAQLSSYSEVGSGAIYKYAPDPRPLSWSDGTPTVSSNNNTDGLYINGAGNGFSFTASADTSTRTLIVHVGGWNSGGTLTAHLSDGSATDFSASTVNTSGQYDYNYTLTYNAASGGQTLTVTWKMSSGSGNVTLCGAALEGASSSGPASITATAGTTQSATVGTAFATALQATVRDSGNNPVSGVSVTFTAPSSGASGSFSGSSTVTTNSSGVATAPTFTANYVAGSYKVSASVSGVATPASFNLTNNGPASITATAGTSQSATVGTAFATALQATVRDSGNNPVSGVAVTFTAPSSGASGSFSGSSTVTTNGSGVATAPTFTANSTAGSYTVTAGVAGVATPANFNLTNNAVVSNGALSGTANNSTAADNLTTEGTSDWVHWGDSSLNRKAGVAAQLSSYSEVGSGAIYKYAPDPRPLSWSDGTPTVSSTNNTDGLYINGAGNGFSFTASADTSTRTLIVHVGGWNSGGTLTAHLSDGSATDFTASTVNTSGQYDYNYTLTYNAASGGQTLTVTWKMSSGSGNVTLCGAALH